jgi:hypothetical protein
MARMSPTARLADSWRIRRSPPELGKSGAIASDGTSAYTWDPSGSALAATGAPGGGTGGKDAFLAGRGGPSGSVHHPQERGLDPGLRSRVNGATNVWAPTAASAI